MKGSIVERETKNGKKYYIVIDLPKGADGKRKQKWFSSYDTRKEAERDLPYKLIECEGYKNSDDLLFKTLSNDYLMRVEQHIAKSTYKRYTSCIKLINSQIGNIKLKKVDPFIIQDYFQFLRNKGYAFATIQKHKAVLGQVYAYGIEMQLVKTSPIPKLKNSTRNQYEEKNVWNAEQVKMFLTAIEKELIYIPVVLASTTGMRQGEITGLKWSDIDFEKKILYVQRSKDFDGTLKSPKTNMSKRSIHLTDFCITALKNHNKQQKVNALKYGKDYIKSDFVCTMKKGKPMNNNYITKTFPRKVEQNHFERIRFHDLRHTFATICLTNGVHAKVVQEILGHSKIQVTLNTYSHVIPSVHEESMIKIGKAFNF